jgi:RNA polymerase sigma factor (sigma-70 family)
MMAMTLEQSAQSWAQIEQYMQLIKYVVWRNAKTASQEDRDDYTQSAVLAVFSRLHQHDERSSLSTYIGRLVQWHVLKVRYRARYKAHGIENVSIDDKISDDGAFTHERFLADTRMDVESGVFEDSRDGAVLRALEVLDDRERNIVEGVYWRGMTITDVAAELGHGRYGSTIHDLALRKIRWAYREATK